jgi:hypothetical protein
MDPTNPERIRHLGIEVSKGRLNVCTLPGSEFLFVANHLSSRPSYHGCMRT